VIDRRTTLKWVAAAAASASLWDRLAEGANVSAVAGATTPGYGTDPDLLRNYRPGELWPLALTEAQRRTAAALSDVIIPADAGSPSASTVGVVDFVDEWISAPYPRQQADRAVLLAGLAWLDRESAARFNAPFAGLAAAQQCSICDDICHPAQSKPEFQEAATFFARFRDLTAGGFYSTAAGRADLQYQGNVALARFDGPPDAVKRRVGV
jgi:Gluconate 2-dehydrogenase subunit 3